MASVGPRSPTANSGSSLTNPANAYTENGTSATRADALAATTYTAHYFSGFDFSAVPDDATIDGVVVEVKGSDTGPGDGTAAAVLTKNGSSAVGSAKSSSSFTTTLAYYTYGGASDLWGTTLTAAEVKASTFGVGLSPINSSADPEEDGAPATTISIDHVRMTVHYTASGGGGGTQTRRGRRRGQAAWRRR